MSAPQVSFSTSAAGGVPTSVAPGGPPSTDPNAYILQDMTDVKTPLPGQGIGASPAASAIAAVTREAVPGASVASSGPDAISTTDGSAPTAAPSAASGFSGAGGSATMGGFSTKETGVQFVRLERDPFTGKEVKKMVKVKTQNQKKGETVYREGIEVDLGDFDAPSGDLC